MNEKYNMYIINVYWCSFQSMSSTLYYHYQHSLICLSWSRCIQCDESHTLSSDKVIHRSTSSSQSIQDVFRNQRECLGADFEPRLSRGWTSNTTNSSKTVTICDIVWQLWRALIGCINSRIWSWLLHLLDVG